MHHLTLHFGIIGFVGLVVVPGPTTETIRSEPDTMSHTVSGSV